MMTVYTETVIHSVAPYQIAIIQLTEAHRVTGRILGQRVVIGDPVTEAPTQEGVRYFQKA